ncbi:MAG: HNH endonuclease [Alphaproteobacteria bacterium]|nr:HNH endonuclease [Alphaproteobacteria bacterium]
MTPDQLREFFQQFQDHLAPKLDTYEQAVYLYIFRHSRFIGQDEAVLSFKSARARLATGIGERGKPMSESSVYKRLDSLEQKHCITVVQTEHKGKRIRLHLPGEIVGVIPSKPTTPEEIDIEKIDFFDPENRLAILQREGFRCFYTLKKIDANSFVVDHVVSRPEGNNSYRNLVAASREANNRKGSMPADDFIRLLYRDGDLNEREFRGRLKALTDLKLGLLKPVL